MEGNQEWNSGGGKGKGKRIGTSDIYRGGGRRKVGDVCIGIETSEHDEVFSRNHTDIYG